MARASAQQREVVALGGRGNWPDVRGEVGLLEDLHMVCATARGPTGEIAGLEAPVRHRRQEKRRTLGRVGLEIGVPNLFGVWRGNARSGPHASRHGQRQTEQCQAGCDDQQQA